MVKELSESERGKLTAGDEICYMSEATPYNRMECELCFGTVEAVDSEFEGEALTYRVTGSDDSSKLLPALFILGVTSGGPLHGFASVFNFGRLPAILLTLSIIACTWVSASSKNPVTLVKELFLRIFDARRFPKSSGVAHLYTTRVRECAHTFNL